MKTLSSKFGVWAVIGFTAVLSGCATHQGTDGRTYYWIEPLPIHNPYNQATAPSATTRYYQVNGRSVTVTSFK